MAKIGIVGGCGYIGSELYKYLSKKHKVVRFDTFVPEDKKKDYCYLDIESSIEHIHDIIDFDNSLDIVIHTAIIQLPKINEDKKKAYYVNVRGLEKVCQVVHHSDTIKALILSGSWHVFGESRIKGIIDENYDYRPSSVYEKARYYA